MKKAGLLIVLGSMVLLNSGCATILGGIIGYQSGEACAGMAIGAAVDFGDDVARGISQMLADVDKEFQKKASVNTDEGMISLPAVAFTTKRMPTVTQSLRARMVEDGWTAELAEKTAETGWFCKDRFFERWRCATSDGEAFGIHIHYKQDENQTLHIIVPEDSSADKAAITARIFKYLGEISQSPM
jgi:hypothetical protein